MQTMQVHAGATIFRTGDPSLAVYVIADGEIAITVGDGAACKEVVRLRAGDLFGESGVLEARCRAATATATIATTLLVTEAETFFHAFGMTNDRALALVKLLCRRLRDTSLRAAQTDPPHTPQLSQPPVPASIDIEEAIIRLMPDRGRLVTEFHMVPIEVRHLPFVVGNSFGAEISPVASNQSCCIAARGEIDLSAPHFEILRRDGELGVRDLRSRFGTIVNGTVLTRASLDTFALLYTGANDVIAGRPNSPFRFRIQVQEA
jgi:CRP-like cAMP-binding protein